jgi:hypothetical protein
VRPGISRICRTHGQVVMVSSAGATKSPLSGSPAVQAADRGSPRRPWQNRGRSRAGEGGALRPASDRRAVRHPVCRAQGQQPRSGMEGAGRTSHTRPPITTGRADATIAAEAMERAIPMLVAVVAGELPAAAKVSDVDPSAPELRWVAGRCRRPASHGRGGPELVAPATQRGFWASLIASRDSERNR